MDTTDLCGRTVLVTGAGSGIGRATAVAAARRGADLVLCDVDGQALQETARRAGSGGGRLSVHVADVADSEQMRRFADEVHGGGVTVDLLINNAGIGLAAAFAETTLDDWSQVIAVNFMGVVHGCQFFVPPMAARGAGHVVNIASMTGYRASPAQIAYSSSKFAVVGFSAALRSDLMTRGVGVSVICPGVIRTSMPEHALWRGRAAAPEVRERITARYLERGHPAGQVADAIFAAVQHNRALVPVGREAWAAYVLQRAAPQLAAWMARHRGSLR